MSLEHSPARSGIGTALNGDADTDSLDYWHSLINENEAGAFLNLTPGTMQIMRQRGDGPLFIRLSARCIRYTRAHLKKYADEHLRTSTTSQGLEVGV